MEPKDTSRKHFFISLIKSVIRIAAGFALITSYIPLAGVLLIAAEILGIVEEL